MCLGVGENLASSLKHTCIKRELCNRFKVLNPNGLDLLGVSCSGPARPGSLHVGLLFERNCDIIGDTLGQGIDAQGPAKKAEPVGGELS